MTSLQSMLERLEIQTKEHEKEENTLLELVITCLLPWFLLSILLASKQNNRREQ